MLKRPILVIDDDPLFCELITAGLTDLGFQVLSAHDGPSGIELARAAQPVVILLDMMMPEVDGIATCKHLKQDPIVGNIPVIGITASIEATYPEQAFQAGAEFFLAKPFRLPYLVEILALAVKRSPHAGDRRASPRFPADLPVRRLIPGDRKATWEAVGRTANVSLGGLMVFLLERLPAGTLLDLTLDLPDRPVPAKGTVIWQGPPRQGDGKAPHGIRFVRFAENTGLAAYRRYLSQVAVPQH
jgi:CheY-like chemotaxis protein